MPGPMARSPPPPPQGRFSLKQWQSPRQQQLRVVLLVLLAALALRLDTIEAYTPRPPQQPPFAATSRPDVPRRTHALRLSIVAGVLALAPPPLPLPLSWWGLKTAAAASITTGGVRSLVNLLRIQSFAKELAASLATTAPGGAHPEVQQQIKYIVKQMQMRASAEDAASTLGGGETARRHGRDAFEYISSIIEFTGYDEMKFSTVSKYNTLSSPERVAFAVRCLQACDRELDAFFAAFPPAKMEEARQLYRAYFAPADS